MRKVKMAIYTNCKQPAKRLGNKPLERQWQQPHKVLKFHLETN